MPVKLNTTSESTPLVTHPVNTVLVDDSTYNSRVLYPNTSQDYSFRVSPGTMAILTAYDINGSDDYMEVYKVLKASGTEQVGGGACCDVVKKATPPKVVKRSLICAWTMADCSPVLIIKTPGVYEIYPNMPNSDITVTLDSYPLQEVNDEINNSP